VQVDEWDVFAHDFCHVVGFCNTLRTCFLINKTGKSFALFQKQEVPNTFLLVHILLHILKYYRCAVMSTRQKPPYDPEFRDNDAANSSN
jgi:hypothetical protein